MTDAAAVDDLIDKVWHTGVLAAIAYTPGILTSGPVADLDGRDIDRTLGVNLVGAMSLAAAVHRRLRIAARPLSMVFLPPSPDYAARVADPSTAPASSGSWDSCRASPRRSPGTACG